MVQISSKVVPDELKSFSKNEVQFFLDKIPSVLKEDTADFFKLFELFLDGVIGA